MSTPPVLILGWGNDSRGDDAIGPLLVRRIAAHVQAQAWHDQVECLEDYQLQIEHCMDLQHRKHVLFIDASTAAHAPFVTSDVTAAEDFTPSSHALSPAGLLAVYQRVHDASPPACTVLAVQGKSYELGAAMSLQAQDNLNLAEQWVHQWLPAVLGLAVESHT
ncbi:hydrogenase maturation protease [Hydrogenophaga sp. 5NK40-0174]|uniref:hydrogenase maturation protease n=1 Tax=Hydrogenophaga sp. 5NK40-0174 TaxID=3127649 RepID=UPI0031087238